LVLAYTLQALAKIPALASFHDWLHQVTRNATKHKEHA